MMADPITRGAVLDALLEDMVAACTECGDVFSASDDAVCQTCFDGCFEGYADRLRFLADDLRAVGVDEKFVLRLRDIVQELSRA